MRSVNYLRNILSSGRLRGSLRLLKFLLCCPRVNPFRPHQRSATESSDSFPTIGNHFDTYTAREPFGNQLLTGPNCSSHALIQLESTNHRLLTLASQLETSNQNQKPAISTRP